MNDYIVRATAADHSIRAFAITSKNIVEEARKDHNTSPVITAALGRLLSGAAMMGTMMKGEKDLLTVQIQCQGPAQGLTVTADSRTCQGISESGRCGTAAKCIGKIRRRRGTWAWCHECDQGYGLKRALCGHGTVADRRDRRRSDLLFRDQ